VRGSVCARERLRLLCEHGAEGACCRPQVRKPVAEEEECATAAEWRQSAQGKVLSMVTECGFPHLLRFFFPAVRARIHTQTQTQTQTDAVYKDLYSVCIHMCLCDIGCVSTCA